jgi:hypothetical protein
MRRLLPIANALIKRLAGDFQGSGRITGNPEIMVWLISPLPARHKAVPKARGIDTQRFSTG